MWRVPFGTFFVKPACRDARESDGWTAPGAPPPFVLKGTWMSAAMPRAERAEIWSVLAMCLPAKAASTGAPKIRHLWLVPSAIAAVATASEADHA